MNKFDKKAELLKDEIDQLRQEYREDLKRAILDIEKDLTSQILNDIINWVSKRLIIIIPTVIIGIVYYFYYLFSLEREINRLKNENQNLRIEHLKEINDIKLSFKTQKPK